LRAVTIAIRTRGSYDGVASFLACSLCCSFATSRKRRLKGPAGMGTAAADASESRNAASPLLLNIASAESSATIPSKSKAIRSSESLPSSTNSVGRTCPAGAPLITASLTSLSFADRKSAALNASRYLKGELPLTNAARVMSNLWYWIDLNTRSPVSGSFLDNNTTSTGLSPSSEPFSRRSRAMSGNATPGASVTFSLSRW